MTSNPPVARVASLLNPVNSPAWLREHARVVKEHQVGDGRYELELVAAPSCITPTAAPAKANRGGTRGLAVGEAAPEPSGTRCSNARC